MEDVHGGRELTLAIVQKPAVYQSAGVFTCLVTEQGRGSMFPGFFTLQRLGTWTRDLHNLIKKLICFLRKGRVHSELCPHDSVSGLSAVAVTVSLWPWSLLSPAACDSVLGLVNGQWSPLHLIGQPQFRFELHRCVHTEIVKP